MYLYQRNSSGHSYLFPYSMSTRHKDTVQFQIPQLPILGPQSHQQLVQDIKQAIIDEATAVDFYSRLLQEAPDQLHREFIEHAYEDEKGHLHAFTQLYTYYTNKAPHYTITPVQYPTYKQGLLMALKEELEAVEFYRDVQLSTMDQLIKETFYFALVDELEHTTRFGVLYNSLQHQL